jgi:Spy/CpxP family protein refolding chaperone
VTLFLAMSLDTLGVSAERRATVEKIRADLNERMDPARAGEAKLVTALAEGVAASNIDAKRVDDAVAQVIAAAAALREASADALNELHAVLTPAERAALVDKVDAHWAVWQKANAEELGEGKQRDGYLEALGAELELTPDQLNKVRARLAEGREAIPRFEPEEVGVHLRAFGDAFRSETFDARTLTTAPDANAHLAGWGAAYMANFVEAVSLVLTPSQRVQFAEKLREHADHNPSGARNP